MMRLKNSVAPSVQLVEPLQAHNLPGLLPELLLLRSPIWAWLSHFEQRTTSNWWGATFNTSIVLVILWLRSISPMTPCATIATTNHERNNTRTLKLLSSPSRIGLRPLTWYECTWEAAWEWWKSLWPVLFVTTLHQPLIHLVASQPYRINWLTGLLFTLRMRQESTHTMTPTSLIELWFMIKLPHSLTTMSVGLMSSQHNALKMANWHSRVSRAITLEPAMWPIWPLRQNANYRLLCTKVRQDAGILKSMFNYMLSNTKSLPTLSIMVMLESMNVPRFGT